MKIKKTCSYEGCNSLTDFIVKGGKTSCLSHVKIQGGKIEPWEYIALEQRELKRIYDINDLSQKDTFGQMIITAIEALEWVSKYGLYALPNKNSLSEEISHDIGVLRELNKNG